jgi:hypothetical protein
MVEASSPIIYLPGITIRHYTSQQLVSAIRDQCLQEVYDWLSQSGWKSMALDMRDELQAPDRDNVLSDPVMHALT